MHLSKNLLYKLVFTFRLKQLVSSQDIDKCKNQEQMVGSSRNIFQEIF